MDSHVCVEKTKISANCAKSLVLYSPAKLNLFLEVLKKRSDGYHDLLTLFERISLSDRIQLTTLAYDEIVVSSKSPDIPLDHNNLAYKAAELIKRSQRIRQGVKIEIDKIIPVGGGLGGGSSDAATVLLGLNKLFSLKLDKKTLIGYANKLGSDVAFFIFDCNFAVGKGRGGELKKVLLPNTAKLWHLLFVPHVKVMTKEVYFLLDQEENLQKKAKKSQKSLKLTKKPDNVKILVSNIKKRDLNSLNRNIYNRLSLTVMESYRLVSDLKDDLLKLGLEQVHMSGSGPTLFMNFKTKSAAQEVFERIHDRISDRCRLFLTSTL
ncbi:MAG: 4-(cytidine 5'-diphospho)-2-C-methyl-D-erythritol kinase [Candidatus Omnitrophota bacterium]